MKTAIRKGFSFGLTSGIITTLGLIVGLHSSTHSTMIVLSGILVIAVADAMSDALGVHISTESEGRYSTKQVWEATVATFLAKLIFAMTFFIPILLLPLNAAIIISIAWGLSLIAVFSFFIAKRNNISAAGMVTEHIGIAVFVIIATHYIGDWAATFV